MMNKHIYECMPNIKKKGCYGEIFDQFSLDSYSLSDPEKVRFLLRSHAFEVRLYKFLASLFKLRDQAKMDPATTVSVEWGEERIGDSSAVLLDRPP